MNEYLHLTLACAGMTISLKTYLDGRKQSPSELQVLADLTNFKIAALCGCSEATVRRWRRTRQWPDYVATLAAYRAGYFIFEGWEGWFVDGDKLYAPFHKHGFKREDVAALPWLLQLASRPAVRSRD